MNIPLTKEELFEILENIYNEIYVIDKNKKIIYINPSCSRNYGILPEEIIGKNHSDFTNILWYPSIIDEVFKQKKPLTIEQVTYTGKKIVSIANPVFDANNNIDIIVCITQEDFYFIDFKNNLYPNKKLIKIEENDINTFYFVKNNKAIKNLFENINLVAKKDLSLLITGESGTGKTMLAKYIHKISNYSSGPFLSINCSTIPKDLLESELFGYESFAFSDAHHKGKKGLIEVANNGTLFLDEIAELPLKLQAKLLNVIESKSFIPVGGEKYKSVNVRFLAASNKNLIKCIKDNLFREDLFWRLNVVNLEIPPLRNRYEDIEDLSFIFLKNFNKVYATNINFSKEVLNLFKFYNWPGNIRQLKNVIERGAILTNSNIITIEDLPKEITQNIKKEYTHFKDYNSFIDACTKIIVQKSFINNNSSRKLAKALDISQTKANNLIKKYCS